MKKVFLYLFLSVNVFAFSPYADDKFDKVLKEVNALKAKVNEQSIQIEGLLSVNGGLSEELHRLRTRPQPKPVDNTALIQDLAKMIDEVSKNSVSKEEFVQAIKKLENEYFAKKPEKAASLPKEVAKSYSGDSKGLYRSAMNDFYAKRYDVAKGALKELEKRKYSLAKVYFFLGETEYYSKNYADALSYYKLSTMENDQANYITLLMYHSAYALERVGNKNLAVTFYKNIKDNYKDKYASLSEKRLRELKVI